MAIPQLHPRNGSGKALGFTLIELLVTLSVVALLASLAAPSFVYTVSKVQSRASATDLVFALLKARSEAVKRNTSVTLSAKEGGWQNGWKILDPADPSNSSLDDHVALPSVVSVSNPGATVTYQSSGRIAGNGAIAFAMAATHSQWCISIDPSGRPYAKEKPC